MKTHRIAVCFTSIMLLSAFQMGCGDDGPRVVKVTGTVTRNGQPVPNVALNFTPTKGRPSWGMADENGKFKLQYTLKRDGAEVGMHKVFVEFPPANPQEEADLSTGKKKQSAERLEILKKYGKGVKPELEIEVKADEKPIEIKLD